jgi:hypothetical protein
MANCSPQPSIGTCSDQGMMTFADAVLGPQRARQMHILRLEAPPCDND